MIPLNKLKRVEEKIKKACECKERGCRTCSRKIKRSGLYANANIPLTYWSLPFKNFEGDKRFAEKIKTIILNIEDFYDSGKSLAFVGNFGTGKTYAASCILKKAIVSGFSAYYISMSGLVDKILSGEHKPDFFINQDFLCIDEYDSRWVFPSEKVERLFSQKLEYILRSRFQNGMPTILCSNTAEIEGVLGGDSKRIMDSLFSYHTEVIFVLGKDYRKK